MNIIHLILSFVFFLPIGLSQESIVLSVGEQKEIPIENMTHISLGSDIVVQKYLPDKKVLLLKGKKIGHTNIIIWNGKLTVYKNEVYCISKAMEMKLIPILNLLKKTHLQAVLSGPFIHVSGNIMDHNDLEVMNYLKKEYKKSTLFQVQFDSQFAKQIVSSIYQWAYNVSNVPFYCKIAHQDTRISCVYESQTKIDAFDTLMEKFPMELMRKSKVQSKNFLLKLKVIQLQNNEGMDFALGPSDISSDLNTFFTTPLSVITQSNMILLTNAKATLSTLGSTQIQVQADKKANIELGSERPFQVASLAKPRIEWKFSGLRMDFILTPTDSGHTFTYTTELTAPGIDDSIEGHKGKSQIFIQLNKAQVLFHIGLQGNTQAKAAMPIVSNLPIIGGLFRPNHHRSAYKKVYLVALLTQGTD